nr:TonB-dependent receptor [Gemmatimonadaceae bacterium]
MLARRIAAVVLAALVAAPVAAQSSGPRPSGGDPTTALLESVPLVFGASRFDQLATEAPASVTVISADDIAGRGWRTLGDALQMVRGFYVTDDGLYPTVGARAFGRPGDYNSRLLLIIDGHRINDYLYDAFGPGFEGILDIADIDRIEIIRGPSSSLYGNSAFFGVINVFTVRGRSLGGVRARVAAESFGTREATLSVGGRTTRGLDVYVSGTVRRSDGRDFFFADFDTSAAGGWARGLDGTARDRATARLAWNGLTITAMANQRRKDYATARYLVDYGVPGNSVRDRQMFIGATYERSLAQGATARAQFSLNHTGYEGRYIYGGERNADFLDAYWLVGEGQLTRPLGTRHRAVFGAQSTVPLKAAQGTRDAVDGAFFNDVRQVLGAVYAQDEVRVGTNWILSGGVRVDYAGTFGVNVSPRLGVIRDLGAGSALKLLYGTAFRAPNNFERFYNAFDFTPNPNVRPERVHTTELLLEQRVHTRAKLSAS